MDHYEISESGRPDPLSCQALACACGVGFSVGTSLPGGAQLATLRRHALRTGLQSSGSRGIVKMHGKEGFKQVLGWPNGVLAFSKTNFYFEQGKVDQKLANGHAEQFFGKSAA